ncbi:putative membrane-anchored protein [Halalkalibacter nanhaiisediminis]|uniref:Putative membrane-anchored protein n=1 Tax=Halalkalibacter nanhaiisediminis TaxID=688079 RepID=A0A562QMR6_9BACI|nr:putative membrane-anchored protein [Halalkalibacter nanhaiisediminis]
MALNRLKMGENRVIDFTYILGLSLVIAAIVYFFAANWGGLERAEKVGLITLLLVVFYGLAFLFAQMLRFRPLVGQLALFAGVMAFGVSVALLYQTYNSHADSYLLFLVWLIPSLLFSVITRLQPFYLLSYVLVHLTFAFYVFPTAISFYRTEGEIILYLLFLGLINAGLFLLIKKKLLRSPILLYLSFIMFHVIWLGLTMRWVFESYSFILNLTYFVILIGSLYWFVKVEKVRVYIILTTLAIAVYSSRWVLSWMLVYASEGIFLLVILLAVALVAKTVYFIKWSKQEQAEKPWWQKLLVTVVSIVSSLLATAAFVGLTSFYYGIFLSSLYVGMAVAIMLVVILLGNRIEETVTHTLIYVGLLLAIAFAWDISSILAILFLSLLPFIWKKTESTIIRVFVHLGVNLFIIVIMMTHPLSAEQLTYLLLFFNLALMLVSFVISKEKEKRILHRNALFYSLLFGFILTFLHDAHPVLYYVYNAGFFIITTYLAFRYLKRNETLRLRMVLLFWFAFLFYKYYDLIWQLLHKSIALFILGAVFLIVALIFDRREKRERLEENVLTRKRLPILLVIVLQLGFIGFQYVQNENVLANGELIKLELEPVDPRSLIQGDYVVLNYHISQIDELADRFQAGEKLKLVLAPNEMGVYEYTGVYQYKGEYSRPYVPAEDDVLIHAKANGWGSFIYGIESYFIEEGTGAEIEENATYAYVRVATNGNALLVELE